jgi:dihydroorotate dehydrogenase
VIYHMLRRVFFLVAPERIHTWVFAVLRTATAPRSLRRGLTRGSTRTAPA